MKPVRHSFSDGGSVANSLCTSSQSAKSAKSVKSVANLLSVFAKGLSLIEIMIAIGILAVSMMLIAAAFPAGVAMSIAVSDETTSQSVFQEALSVIRDNYKISVIPVANRPTDTYTVIPDNYLSWNGSAYVGEWQDRQYGDNGIFSWSALIRRSATAGPMGNLCHVIVVVSRQPSGGPRFVPDPTVGGDEDDEATWTGIPELKRVLCTDSDTTARTITVDPGNDSLEPDDLPYFARMPNTGYMIDGDTGIPYSIISRNEGTNNTVTLLTTPPDDIDTDPDPRYFWIIPGEYDGTNYGRVSPAVRVFQATLYLP